MQSYCIKDTLFLRIGSVSSTAQEGDSWIWTVPLHGRDSEELRAVPKMEPSRSGPGHILGWMDVICKAVPWAGATWERGGSRPRGRGASCQDPFKLAIVGMPPAPMERLEGRGGERIKARHRLARRRHLEGVKVEYLRVWEGCGDKGSLGRNRAWSRAGNGAGRWRGHAELDCSALVNTFCSDEVEGAIDEGARSVAHAFGK